jgi:hypothetical protein
VNRSRTLAIAGLGIAVGLLAACQGPASSSSVQAGGSVVIPIADHVAWNAGQIGFGSQLAPDPQRGKLVYRLDDASGTLLTTRATTTFHPTPSTQLGIAGYGATATVMVASLVDIPADAPRGTHNLHVVRERVVNGQTLTNVIPYAGQIRILDDSYTVQRADGTNEVIAGTPTPWKGALLGVGSAFLDVPPNMQAWTIPKAEVVIRLNKDVHALELRVDYPTSVIDVRDVYQPLEVLGSVNHDALVWWSDQAGTLDVSAVSGGDAFREIAIAFDLDDGNQAILDPQAQITVLIDAATDANGAAVPAPITITKLVR